LKLTFKADSFLHLSQQLLTPIAIKPTAVETNPQLMNPTADQTQSVKPKVVQLIKPRVAKTNSC